MKFGVREICDVVLKAKANQKVGNKIFYKNEPVIYFDTLKTSSMEGAATTVYAQGGRGNSRLMAWEGERTVTFTMEDALISPAGFMILSGAGLIEAKSGKPIYVHVAEQTDIFAPNADQDATAIYVVVDQPVSSKGDIYVMPLIDGEIQTEPFKAVPVETNDTLPTTIKETDKTKIIKIVKREQDIAEYGDNDRGYEPDLTLFTKDINAVLVDYYTEKESGAQQIEITPDKFGGNYYLEASTLFRDTNGVDMPAEFIIPNCKIQSNFTFTMASSGDPSTFTFTMDAFPDYTMFDRTKKVLAAIQIVGGSDVTTVGTRANTETKDTVDDNGQFTWTPKFAEKTTD